MWAEPGNTYLLFSKSVCQVRYKESLLGAVITNIKLINRTTEKQEYNVRQCCRKILKGINNLGVGELSIYLFYVLPAGVLRRTIAIARSPELPVYDTLLKR